MPVGMLSRRYPYLRKSTFLFLIAFLVSVLYFFAISPILMDHKSNINGLPNRKSENDPETITTRSITQAPISTINVNVNVKKEINSIDAEPINSKNNNHINQPIEVYVESPIDNSMSSLLKSFPTPISFSSSDNNKITKPAVLVVGGTDGSGTRSVVQLLTELGVTMVSEDPETYDIHADLVGGWPEIVKPVIRETKSLNYNPDRLSLGLVNKERMQLRKLLAQVDKDSTKPQSKKLAVGGALNKPKGTSCSKISYGFKAPVAMTLAPWWADTLSDFRMLHVLRDGRDISFSANQGPVEKFYNDMYGTSPDRYSVPVKAIRLWSDWNSQLYNWSKDYMNSLKLKSSVESFGYHVIHSEDLVDDDNAVRFAAVVALAEFVGSSLSTDALCCLSLKDSEFMGSHDRTPKEKSNSEAQVQSRYGKWRNRLVGNRGLSDELHKVGEEGLRIFGYEPMRELADSTMATSSGYKCGLTDK
eukprot:gene9312-12548_t